MSTNEHVATGDKASKKTATSTKVLEQAKQELAALQRKLSKDGDHDSMDKKCGLVDVQFCKWCKCAEQKAYNMHDSKQCFIKFPELSRGKLGEH